LFALAFADFTHCFRHTYATTQLACGTDLYTVSKMLAHKNISTTQVYTHIVNKKLREAANRINLRDTTLPELNDPEN